MGKKLEYLIDALKSLPGVGTKHATIIANFLVKKDQIYINEFIKRISEAKNSISFCEQCNNMIEGDKKICDICSDFSRDNEQLCIVSTSEDLKKIEGTGEYKGLYFVLNEEADQKTRKGLNEGIIKKLIGLINKYSFKEITIATNWTNNGEITASILKKTINENFENITLYRLAVGLPINSAVDYADKTTLKHAISNKFKY